MLALNGADPLNGPRQWGSLLFCLVIVLSLQRAEGSTEETGSSYTKIRILPDLAIADFAGHPRTRLVEQPVEAALDKAPSPLPDGLRGYPFVRRHRLVAQPGGTAQHDARPQRQCLRRLAPL